MIKKMHRFLIVITGLLVIGSIAADDPVVPAGVTYKKSTDAINDAAKDKIQKLFNGQPADKDVLAFFQEKVLICGPGLWKEIKNDPAMAKIDGGSVTFKVPVLDGHGKTKRMDTLDGKLMQTDEDVLAFWKVLAGRDDYKECKIRKLTSDELNLYWAMISFDISEPVFVLETKKSSILLQFTSPDVQHSAFSSDPPCSGNEPDLYCPARNLELNF